MNTNTDDFEDIFATEGGPTWAYGEPPMTARITIGQGHGQTIMLRCPSSSSREEAYAAVQAHYAHQYGPHVKITVQHLSTTPEDQEEGTVANSASVTGRCDHGLSQRICTVNVVTQEGRT